MILPLGAGAGANPAGSVRLLRAGLLALALGQEGVIGRGRSHDRKVHPLVVFRVLDRQVVHHPAGIVVSTSPGHLLPNVPATRLLALKDICVDVDVHANVCRIVTTDMNMAESVRDEGLVSVAQGLRTG